jgi:glycosyltransferase involved in cell wall biosynthesis
MADKELEELEQEALAELDDGSEEQEAQEPEVVDEEPEPEGEPDGGDEVNVGDVDDLANKILKILKNKQLKNNLSIKALKRVQDYSLDNIITKFEKELLSN